MTDTAKTTRAGGSGWSGKTLRRGAGVAAWVEGFGPPVPYDVAFDIGVEDKPGTSENHEAELWGIEAMRSAQARVTGLREADEQFQVARRALVEEYLPRELARGPRGVGLGGNEGLVPDAHTHQHLAGVLTARAAAVIARDNELLELTNELVLRWARLMRATSTRWPHLFMASACFRSPRRPVFFVATALSRQLAGLPGPMPNFERKPANWTDPMHLPVRVLRWLQPRDAFLRSLAGERGVAPGGCPMRHRMVVYRKEGTAHLVVIPPLKGKGPGGAPEEAVCSWCWVPHGARSFHELTERIEFAFGWEREPPSPPRGAKEIEFPSTGGADDDVRGVTT